MQLIRISSKFYAWKREEKQAYEYCKKKTHDIHANFTRFILYDYHVKLILHDFCALNDFH